MEITENTKTLKFDANGLIPAIVQDHYTKEVLTLAYMNAETLALTIAEGRTVFWSRSRQEIWRKGETSGNVQRVVSITADCDKDALVVDVIKNGPACHTELLLQPGVCVGRAEAVHLAGAVRTHRGPQDRPERGQLHHLSV